MKMLLYLQRAVPLCGLLLNKLKFPGLWTGLHVEITSAGIISYGKGVKLGEGTRVDVSAGSKLRIEDGVIVGRNAVISLPASVELRIGAATAVQDNCRLQGQVSVGKDCIFAPNVFISSGSHTFDKLPHLSIKDQDRIAAATDQPVRIFDDCWFGVNSVVQPGITIGRGCVIGANSVITQDLPPYSVAAGNPARVLRTRLNFVPKSRIEATRAEDLPYFYDGFRDTLLDAGLQVAGSEFILALDLPNARSVRICICGTGEIRHGHQSKKIPKMPTVVEFSIDSDKSMVPFLVFNVAGTCQINWAELF